MQTIYDVLVIGSGFSGICMGIKLKEAGIQNYLIVEKASELGGTWRENTYPGCACDVKSHLYSFSFEGNPNWSGAYSGWREIKTYIKHCADKYDITSHIQFNTEINSATFNAHKGIWIISDTNGQQFQSRTIVLGTGPLHVPAFPKIKGLEDFKGEIFHSARWNHRYNLNGKRVASIGTGASAIQYVPEIAPQVQQLDVYQRTPAWVLPRDENQYTETQKFIFKQVPAIRKFHRYAMYWFNETRLLPIKNPVIANALSVVAKSNIKKTIKSPELLKKLTPNYAIGCKRVLVSNKYYPTFNRDNVELLTDPIKEITAKGVMTQNGAIREVDTIILGTGFVVDPREYLSQFQITGLKGQALLDRWREGAEAYLGITVPGFPNLFQMTGPNTSLGHNSIVFMIECQVRYIMDCLHRLKEKQAKYLDVRETVHTKYNSMIQKNLKNTVWNSGCTSWYQQADGKNFTIWPGFTFLYQQKTMKCNPDDYWWERSQQPAISIESTPQES